MKQEICTPTGVPTVNICIQKSRVKLYHKDTTPTYYLQNSQEFTIELRNPTSDVILAKVTLNGKPISQGGLVLNPGQHTYLERYLDVAKKFKFDTYEVSGSDEIKKAIANNGTVKVEFYKELTPVYNPGIVIQPHYYPAYPKPYYPYGQTTPYYPYNNIIYCGGNAGTTIGSSGVGTTTGSLTNGTSTTTSLNVDNATYTSNNATYTSSNVSVPVNKSSRSSLVETGRVEQGSSSSQTFTDVNKSFNYFPTYTIEYKLLPISQKVNTVEDINVKVYCKNCGTKLGKTDRFCSSCGTKI